MDREPTIRTRPNTPRTGRAKKLRLKRKRKIAGKRNPRQLAAATGRNRVRKTRRR